MIGDDTMAMNRTRSTRQLEVDSMWISWKRKPGEEAGRSGWVKRGTVGKAGQDYLHPEERASIAQWLVCLGRVKFFGAEHRLQACA